MNSYTQEDLINAYTLGYKEARIRHVLQKRASAWHMAGQIPGMVADAAQFLSSSRPLLRETGDYSHG